MMKNKLSIWWAIAIIAAMWVIGQAAADAKCIQVPLVGWVCDDKPEKELSPTVLKPYNKRWENRRDSFPYFDHDNILKDIELKVPRLFSK